ncbi:sugar ABC transporter substrate-binding protein [Mesorhizobium australicum]|uniref:Ribose transport system substrate-binding protein n=1 Tax=Mesorhizobium australicum TaxID=536018 RepID=A0A1X7N0S7_9HYPH|nr:sugar ABC transporter substrate-binding protein [Mesorhizobium australicum]SMH30839.1 ribose transport system substrate-binding protein [Mesorhizobium australicum]
MRKIISLAVATVLGCAGLAVAQDVKDDGQSATYYESLKGKRVAFVPVAMGFDLTEGWFAGMQNQAEALGYTVEVRDPNWSTEAATQAANGFIAEKPDVLVLHPLDRQAYNRIVPRAMAEGINVIQINLKSVANGDVYVGADWYQIATLMAEDMVKACGQGSGKNGKVAYVLGRPNTPGVETSIAAYNEVLKQDSSISIVAEQMADYDATKAQGITATLLKQHPDLCGVMGIWDGQDIGISAAARDAGMLDKLHIVTSGGGAKSAACDNVENGNFGAYFSYDVPGQTRDLNAAVKMLLQTKPKPGSTPFALYTPIKRIAKDNLAPSSCWTLDELKRSGG